MKVFFSAEDNSGDAFFFTHFFCCATAYFSLSCHMSTLIYMYRVIVVLGFLCQSNSYGHTETGPRFKVSSETMSCIGDQTYTTSWIKLVLCKSSY